MRLSSLPPSRMLVYFTNKFVSLVLNYKISLTLPIFVRRQKNIGSFPETGTGLQQRDCSGDNLIPGKHSLQNFFTKRFSISKLLVILFVFNIITRKTLLEYCKKYPAAATALQEWYHELVNCAFKSFNELKQVYGNASLVADDRVVFNIMGNKYRLVVRIVFDFKAIQVKWFGTHAEYNKIDETTVQNKKN